MEIRYLLFTPQYSFTSIVVEMVPLSPIEIPPRMPRHLFSYISGKRPVKSYRNFIFGQPRRIKNVANIITHVWMTGRGITPTHHQIYISTAYFFFLSPLKTSVFLSLLRDPFNLTLSRLVQLRKFKLSFNSRLYKLL